MILKIKSLSKTCKTSSIKYSVRQAASVGDHDVRSVRLGANDIRIGLLNLQGIAKPLYRAFELLHRLGDKQFPVTGEHATVDVWVIGGADNFTVMATNYERPRHPLRQEHLCIALAGAPRPKAVCVERIDEKHELLATMQNILDHEFIRLPYTEAIDVLSKSGQKFEYPLEWGADLQSEHERFLTEQHFKQPVILFDYPRTLKPFYMRCNDDGKTVRAMDVLVPRVGEIIGGSQREERLDVLLERMTECHLDPATYWWYVDLRRYGTVPHSGFGLGFERLIQLATGMANIRDCIPFPRVPKSADF